MSGPKKTADDLGAPELETPESPKAPPNFAVERLREGEWPEPDGRTGDIAPGPVQAPDIAPTSEESVDATTADYGVGSTPAARASAFSPPATITDQPTTDAGLGSAPSTRPDVFDAPN